MKKLLCLLLAVAMVLAMSACSKDTEEAPPEEEIQETAVWERTGYFQDEDGDLLTVANIETEDFTGWFVGCKLGEEIYGSVIPLEAEGLHGNLAPASGLIEFIVTVSEEGPDGLKLAVEGGKVYHFTPLELKNTEFTVHIETEGVGRFAYAEAGKQLDKEYPYTWAQFGLEKTATYEFAAKAGENWNFVKWTLDGKDYSKDAQISVELTGDANLVAVFEYKDSKDSKDNKDSKDSKDNKDNKDSKGSSSGSTPAPTPAGNDDGQNPVMGFIGTYSAGRAHATVSAEGASNARVVVEWGDSAWSSAKWVMSGRFDEDTLTMYYSNCAKSYITYGSDGSVESESYEYDNGTGRVTFGTNGTFTWVGDQSEQEDLTFEWTY